MIPLRLRLTLFFAVVVVVALGCFGVSVWWIEGRYGQARLDNELDDLAATLANVITHELEEGLSIAQAAAEAGETISGNRAMALLDADGRVIAAAGTSLNWPASRPGTSVLRSRLSTEAGPWRVRTAARSFAAQEINLAVASSLADVERQQREILRTLAVALPLAILLAAGGGLWMATRTYRPVEDALRTQRQFMADASHELRTPTSVIRTSSDVALSRTHRDEIEYREALTIVNRQAERLSRLVESMLVLARADAGGYPVQRAELYLDEVVADCCRAVGVLCEERGILLERGIWAEVPARGDEELLRRMMVNLLTNAVQHSPAGAVVRVDLLSEDRCVGVSVADQGPGIPAADRERIFHRFVQLDSARTREGAGLGLPIARWIAEAHGGSLKLADSGAHGSRFVVTLPAAELS